VNYGLLTSIALDPIEKKPLAKFYPGSYILSVGSFGCNMTCPFCQNHSISAMREPDAETRYVAPDELASLAQQYINKNNIGVAFTYNEPLIGYEYVIDTSREVKKRGMKTVAVTNGLVLDEVAELLLPWLDAYNIDLKGFTEEGYNKLGGDLETVKKFIISASKAAHVEITALIVPGENDGENEMSELSSWLAGIDRKIPLHITRFFPRYKMRDRKPTDIGLMRGLKETADKKLDTVILGNI
jgi:pyruvate formate lyase activating enzyme